MSYSPPKTPLERRMEAILVKCLYREATASEEKELRGLMDRDAALRGRMEAMERILVLLGEIPVPPSAPQLVAEIQAMARREILKERRAGTGATGTAVAEASAPEPVAAGAAESPVERWRGQRRRGRGSFRRTWLPLLAGAAIALAIIAVVWFAFLRYR